jgi:hypothetical protein
MLKVCAERGMVTDGWISLDPADLCLVERFTKRISVPDKEKPASEAVVWIGIWSEIIECKKCNPYQSWTIDPDLHQVGRKP